MASNRLVVLEGSEPDKMSERERLHNPDRAEANPIRDQTGSRLLHRGTLLGGV